MQFRLVLFLTAIGALVWAGAPAAQQTKKGTAAETAGAWKASRTPWGDPDLQGIYTNKDENYTPFERPADLAGKRSVRLRRERDGAAAASAAGRGRAGGEHRRHRRTRTPAPGRSHWYEHLDAVNAQPWLVIEPDDGKVPPLTQAARDRAAARQAARSGPRSGRLLRPIAASTTAASRAACPTHAADHLRRVVRHHAGAGLRGHPQRDDSRGPGDPARRPAAAVAEDPAIHGRRAGPVGGRHAGRRDDEHPRRDALSRRLVGG